MTAEQTIRFLIHEAPLIRRLAYEAGDGSGPDENILEGFLLLHPVIGKALDLRPMDDVEANAVRYQLKQELIGKNGHVTTI